jgi:hypothetical protein
MMKFLWLVPIAVCGQTLQVQSEPASSGHAATLEIRLDSPPGKEPVALQWELDYPGSAFRLDFENITAGDAAKSAGKSIRCSLVAREKRDLFRYRCILAGGSGSVLNGPIAIVPYAVTPGGKPGRYPFKLRNGLSVGQGLKEERLKDAGMELTVSK